MKQWATGRAEEVRLARLAELPAGRQAIQAGRPQDFNNFMKIVVDAGAADARTTGIPSGVYNFATVFNNTRFDFSLSRGLVFNPLEIIGNCPAYTLLTFPFDRETADVFIRWEGPIGASERCMIFLTEENLGLVGQFRPPALVLGTTPDRILFNGVASVTTLVTATQKIIIRSIYIVNTATTASNITLAHRISGVDRHILSNVAIPANTTHALGHIVLDATQDLRITAFTGTITILIYGEGI